MITIIHGDDIVSSRRNFIDQKQKTSSAVIYDGKALTMTDVIQAFEGAGLFGETKNIFIENFFSLKKVDEIVSYIKKNNTHQVLFWEGRELTKSTLAIFPGAKILTFKLPQILFSFLDNLKPGHGKDLIKVFHNLLQSTEAELAFYMLIRQFRLLVVLSSNDLKGTIDEVNRLIPWQKEKLKKQAKLFSFDQLRKIYQRLYEVDLNQKTGQSSLTIVQNIDFFLLDI